LLDARDEEIDPAEMTIARLRQRARESINRWQLAGVRDYDIASSEDVYAELDGATTRLRVYQPRVPSHSDDRKLPIVVYLHGGGWVMGDLDAYDGICRAVCESAAAVVVSVEYRLAPEHPYPIPLQDCEQALLWVQTNASRLGGDPSAVFIAGDSAGGNLAAVCALGLRQRLGHPLKGQILIYPATDDPSSGHPSMEEFKIGHEYGQSFSLLSRMMNLYVGDRITLSDPAFAPLRTDSLAGAPGALVITAEYDMLRDEGEAYAERLRAEGVDVVCRRFEGVNHGFMHLTKYLPATDEAFRLIGAWMRAKLAPVEGARPNALSGETNPADL
jgi:acetyl esterase